jgi:hypothetical protein
MTIAGWSSSSLPDRRATEQVEVMPKLLALPLLAVALCSTDLLAQNHLPISGSPAHGARGAGGHRPSVGIGFGEGMHRRPFRRTPYFYGAPYFYSDFNSYEPEDQAPAPSPQPAPVVQVKAEPLPDAVLLELRGNQWVKVTSFGEASAQALSPTPAVQTPSPKEMPPAVLIYRDGHSEEVSSYSIIGPVMYTKSDYWSSGAWTRTIRIADLDVPATLKQNHERGVRFDLPSGPDEVIIRP